MARELYKSAMQAGAASNITARRLGAALDRVVGKLEAQYEEVPDASGPTDIELAALRDRYLESKALDEHSQSLWRQVHDHPSAELVGIVLKILYRLTLFAAAVVILHRAILDWIPN